MKRKRFLKRSQILKITTNSKEYKIWRSHIENPQNCWYCAPHVGCNYYRGENRKPYRSWKFRSKKPKQWI